jgi:hypothetical protein
MSTVRFSGRKNESVDRAATNQINHQETREPPLRSNILFAHFG